MVRRGRLAMTVVALLTGALLVPSLHQRSGIGTWQSPWQKEPKDREVPTATMQVVRHDTPSSSSQQSPPHLVFPPWMVEYLHWHSTTKQQLTPNNWHQYQYLIVRCYVKDRECGGASDRLQSLPYFVLLAHASQRLLLVHWTRPAPLEEFLLPPPSPLTPTNSNSNNTNLQPFPLSRLDWSVPDWLATHFPYPFRPLLFSRRASYEHFELVRNASFPFIDAYDQSHDHGAAMYDSLRKNHTHNTDASLVEPSFDQVLGPLWHATYLPSPPVAKVLQHEQAKLGLLPLSASHPLSLISDGGTPPSDTSYYVALHVRSRYHRDKSSQTAMLQNAIHCAMGLLVNGTTSNVWSTASASSKSISSSSSSSSSGKANANKINDPATTRLLYVTTDSINATRYAVQYGNELLQALRPTTTSESTPPNNHLSYRVVSRNMDDHHAHDPLHLDRGSVYLKGGRHGPRLDWDHFNASDYYDTFVDLYLLAGAHCTAFGVGGYGKWANRLSPNPNCYIDYSKINCPRPW